ncbi:hypothetical protein CEXT_228311 [Caerostris extrusa]|uniref:Uncharacterized protein n=1 Tax=Caerostris extrusa TaxID=172846 RepID=A0AAV4VU15_CAEEX|nr:hypothetical protein CEXT_228311 [Caerostris extrusa]
MFIKALFIVFLIGLVFADDQEYDMKDQPEDSYEDEGIHIEGKYTYIDEKAIPERCFTSLTVTDSELS